ncbi:uncharacterized protein LOC129915613 isoform X2 [Episyrphus balteatus]|uniref:uncharacterized protein LOC129915613 isoform X2 n=1 Tax=Episyrphus balteatus TaxID=286459 RepID=UPI002486B17A|nr:uncharacterized protein LOC129915613 isoform X2 [Episyrphus balteatus]
MNTYQIITLFAILLRFGDIDANKFNISLSHLDNCKEYAIISEDYKYKNFFQINSMNSSKLEDNQKLHLKFFVMAPRDAFILLTEFENHTNSERFYEINFGGNDNSRSSMYEKGKGVDKQIVLLTTPNLLSTFDPMPIEIIQTNGGHLIVHIPGFLEFFISYKDSNPLNIRFFSFSSWAESSAKWYYDCTLEEMKDQKIRENEVKTVETKKTNVNQQQLSEDQKMPENEVKTVETKKTNVNQQQLSEDQKMPENEVKTDETKKTNVNQQQLSEDQKMPENEVKTVETKKTNVNQQQLSQQPKSTANPTETRPFSRHNSFFDLLVPMLVKFDDNKMLDFKLGVLELIKKLKNPPTTTTEKPVAIDVRIDDSEESS